jgi:hypothetical protein
VIERIEAHVGMSGSGGSGSAVVGIVALRTTGTAAAADIAFKKSLLFRSSIRSN